MSGTANLIKLPVRSLQESKQPCTYYLLFIRKQTVLFTVFFSLTNLLNHSQLVSIKLAHIYTFRKALSDSNLIPRVSLQPRKCQVGSKPTPVDLISSLMDRSLTSTLFCSLNDLKKTQLYKQGFLHQIFIRTISADR